jgi:glycosyltransferase involved in cell wall biosynthesis
MCSDDAGVKIKVIVTHFLPEDNALTSRLGALLPCMGARHSLAAVFLLEPGKAFDERRVREGLGGLRVDLFPVRAGVYEKGNLPRRAVGELRNNLRLWRRASRIAADVTWVSVPQLMLLPVSAIFVPFCRGHRILELRDLTWECVDRGDGFAARLVGWLLERMARFSIRRFDEVVTCTEAQAEYVRRVTRLPVSVVRNGISKAKFDRLALEAVPGRENGVFTVAYIGNVGLVQNVMTLVKAAERLGDKLPVKFLIAGGGVQWEEIRRYAAERKLANVELTGPLSWEGVRDCYQRSDVLYAQLRGIQGLEKAEPSKLFEYFATGRPVIFGGAGSARAFAAQFENVELVAPDDPAALAGAIERMMRRKPGLSSNNRRRIQEGFIRERLFSAYLDSCNWSGGRRDAPS